MLFTKTSNRTEDTHEYMALRRRYPQPGSSNHQHPHHPQPTPSGVLSNGDHGTTEVINYPRHYVTRIPSRQSDDSDYKAPVSVDQTPVYQEIQYIMKTSMMMLKKPKLKHSLPRFWASIHPVHHG